MTDDNNLLQIQQVIEAAQRELRRLCLRSEVDRLFAVHEAIDASVNGIESDDSGGRESRNSSEDAGLSPDDASGGVISMMASTRQIFITRSGQSQEPNAETRQEAIQTNEPLIELDLSLGDRTDWTLAGPQELQQQLPRHNATEFSSQVQQVQRELDQINGHAQQSDNVGVAGLGSGVDELASPASPDDQELDRRLGRATPSSLPDPGNVLDQIPGVGNSWVIRPGSGTQEEILATANGEEPSLDSDEDLSDITPLPSPTRSLHASLRREAAPLNSSNGAIAGSEVVVGEAEEQPPFTNQRRARLMAEMNANIARYSQQREWAFYREHGYGVLPIAEPPEPVHVGDRNPSGPARIREESLNRQELHGEVSLVTAAGRRLENLEGVRNRAELPQSSELPDHEEDFLVYLLEKIVGADGGIQFMAQREQFVERRVPPSRARVRYQLAGLGPVSRGQDLTYCRLCRLLGLDRTEAIRIARAIRLGESVDHIRVGQPNPLEYMMLIAVQDGMNVRQAVAFLTEWFLWLEHTAEIWPTPGELIDIRILQFWVALRHGWGGWQPSQEMLNRVREALQLESSIIHPLYTGEPGFDDFDDENSLSSIRASDLPPEEQDRFRRLREDDRLHHGRIEAIYVNWRLYIRNYVLSSELGQTSEFRLNRLERLIREERVMNASRSPSN